MKETVDVDHVCPRCRVQLFEKRRDKIRIFRVGEAKKIKTVVVGNEPVDSRRCGERKLQLAAAEKEHIRARSEALSNGFQAKPESAVIEITICACIAVDQVAIRCITVGWTRENTVESQFVSIGPIGRQYQNNELQGGLGGKKPRNDLLV